MAFHKNKQLRWKQAIPLSDVFPHSSLSVKRYVLLFLKRLDNSKKVKQSKRGEAVLNMDWQGWMKDKTNQDCLGKRVCTEQVLSLSKKR